MAWENLQAVFMPHKLVGNKLKTKIQHTNTTSPKELLLARLIDDTFGFIYFSVSTGLPVFPRSNGAVLHGTLSLPAYELLYMVDLTVGMKSRSLGMAVHSKTFCQEM